MLDAEKSIPLLAAAGGNSAYTASSCRRNIPGEQGSTAVTRRGFCAVRHVIALVPCTPKAANVFRSAWMPAPPPLSEPATVSAPLRDFDFAMPAG